MKLSWGHRITILYSGFVVLILTLVSLTMREKVDLIYTDYYAREVDYQNTLDKMKNFNTIGKDVVINQDNSNISFSLPAESIHNFKNGSIKLIRTSNSSMDQTLNMVLKNNIALVNKKSLTKGYYLMQLEWEANSKTYLIEKSITVN